MKRNRSKSSTPLGSRRTEFLIVGTAVVVAVVAALIAQFGGVPRAQALVGLVVILGIAYLASNNRRAIDLSTVAWGLGLQILFALIVLKTEVGQLVFQKASDGITRLLAFADVGSSFVFGPLGNKEAWPRIVTPGKASR